MDFSQLPKAELIRLLEQYSAERAEVGKDGIIMSYTGRTAPWQIIRLIKPKLTSINKRLSIGTHKAQAENLVLDGENLSAMASKISETLPESSFEATQSARVNQRPISELT